MTHNAEQRKLSEEIYKRLLELGYPKRKPQYGEWWIVTENLFSGCTMLITTKDFDVRGFMAGGRNWFEHPLYSEGELAMLILNDKSGAYSLEIGRLTTSTSPISAALVYEDGESEKCLCDASGPDLLTALLKLCLEVLKKEKGGG